MDTPTAQEAGQARRRLEIAKATNALPNLDDLTIVYKRKLYLKEIQK